MINNVFKQLFTIDYPLWFRLLNLSILLPILIYPVIIYSVLYSIIGNKNTFTSLIIFFLTLTYPLILIALANFNSKLFVDNKTMSLILPIFFLTISLGYYSYLFFSIKIDEFKSNQYKKERIEKGYLPENDSFRIYNGKVYYMDTLIPGADGYSFEIIDYNWQKDNSTIYFFGKPMPQIDKLTFTKIDNDFWKDKSKVYYIGEEIEGADPETFEVLNHSMQRDKLNVYILAKPINYIDVASFEAINMFIFKDKNYVYDMDEIIVDADPHTFHLIDEFYQKDKFTVYYQLEAKKEMDSESFVALGMNYYKDKNFVYIFDKKINGADLETFVVDEKLYVAKDKNYEYNYGKIIDEP